MTRASEIAHMEDIAFRSHRTFQKQSSMFASTTERFPRERTESPPPGAYECHTHEMARSNVHSRTDFSFRSGSPRLAPTVTSCSPASGTYEPYTPPRRKSGESSTFKSTSPRLPAYPAEGPGPTSYNAHEHQAIGIKKSTSASSFFQSASPRLPEPRVEGPPIVAYSADRQGRTNQRESAVFRSKSPRLLDQKPASPDYYAPDNGTIASTLQKQALRAAPNASYKSATPRMHSPRLAGPGPGFYEVGRSASAPRNRGASAVFKSSSPRLSALASDSPGPGAYGAEPQQRTNTTNQRLPSPCFRSNSDRFRSKTPETPPPGAYEIKSTFANQSKSQGATGFRSSSERFPTPKAESPGPGSYYTNEYDTRLSAFLHQPFGPGSNRLDQDQPPPAYQ